MRIEIKHKNNSIVYDDDSAKNQISYYYSEHREAVKELISHSVSELKSLND